MSRKKKNASPKPMDGALSADPLAGKIRLLAAIVWLGLLLVHANKGLGFNPLVIPDEYTYISDIRHRGFAQAEIPNYLYYALYQVVNLFPIRFMDAARVLNALFFMLSAPFLFKTARLVCGAGTAALLTLLALVAPFSSYIVYFMPEPLYFTGVSIFAWLLLGRDWRRPEAMGAAAGLGIAVLALIKVHGIFLVPGFVLYALFVFPFADRGNYLRAVLRCVASCLAVFFLARFGLGLLFAGVSGLNLLGRSYSSYAAVNYAAAGGAADLSRFLIGTLFNLIGNLEAIAVVYALPVAAAVSCLGLPAAGDDAAARLRRIAAFSVAFLVPLLAVTAGFSAMSDLNFGDGDLKAVERIQMRYYNFLFPFFVMVLAGTLEKGFEMAGRAVRWSRVILPFLAVNILFVMKSGFSGYFPGAIPDAPEIGEFHTFSPAIHVVAAISGLLCVVALKEWKKAAGVALRFFLPACFVAACVLTQAAAIYASFVVPDIHAKGGAFAREYLGGETADLTLVDWFLNSAKTALILIDDPAVDLVVSDGQVVDMAAIRPEKKWLLVFGDLAVPRDRVKYAVEYLDPSQTPELIELMRQRGTLNNLARYALVRIADFEYSVDFRAGTRSWPVRRVWREGGAWLVEYAMPLPAVLRVESLDGGGGAEWRVGVRPDSAWRAPLRSDGPATVRLPEAGSVLLFESANPDAAPPRFRIRDAGVSREGVINKTL